MSSYNRISEFRSQNSVALEKSHVYKDLEVRGYILHENKKKKFKKKKEFRNLVESNKPFLLT